MVLKTPVFNIDDKTDRGRLTEAIAQSDRDMSKFISNRETCLSLYRGPRWPQSGNDQRVPVPFMQNALDLYVQHLSSAAPRALVTTGPRDLQSTAEKLGLAHNRLVEEINLAGSLEMFVRDAMIGFPMMKVSYSAVSTSRMHGIHHEAGQPFADVVLTPDVIIDTNASSFDKVSFIGNRYRVPLAWVKTNAGRKGIYRRDAVAELVAVGPGLPEGLHGKKKRSGGTLPVSQPIYEQVELIDLYFPFDNWFVTIPAPEHHGGDLVLLSEAWQGPEEGPYVPLALADTQGEVLPVPPAWAWIDGHDAVNALYNKLIEQAEDMKEVIGVQGNAVRDGDRLIAANHGEIWRFDHPQNVKEYRFSGPDQAVLSFAIHLRSLLSNVAGNTDLMGGLSAESATATQDQLLFAQGTKRLQDLQRKVLTAIEKVMRRLMWYLFYDPQIDIPLTRRSGGVTIRSRFTADQIRGDFLDYNFKIDPYSMQFKSPEQRMGQLLDIVNQVVLPLAPFIMQQGNTVDVMELLKIMGDYSGITEIGRVVKQTERPMVAGGSPQGGSPQPSAISRQPGGGSRQNPAGALSALPAMAGSEQL